MKHFITILCSLLFAANITAQDANKDVTITASGSGATLEEAKQSALRSATEQAFGAFISSKTEIFNDQVVADQMSSVSSGNIKSYEVLNDDQLPDGRYGVTLKAIVSVDKLTSFVQAKGVEIEIKGGLFALNIKQQLLNEQGEIEAVYAMVGLLHEPMQTAFDYTIKSGDLKSTDAESKNWEIPLEVTATCNKNMDFCANYFIKTLRALSLSAEEVASYKTLNKKVFSVNVSYAGKSEVFYLRKEMSIAAIKSLISNWEFYIRLFVVHSGIDQSNGNLLFPINPEIGRSGGGNGYGNGELFDFTNYNRDYYIIKNVSAVINFPTAGEYVGKFNWSDKKTLLQIEKITAYEVKPMGVVVEFRHGGYVLYENEGTGIVMSLADIESVGRLLEGVDFYNARSVCNDLILNGYEDWRLPSVDELEIMYNKMTKLAVGNLLNYSGYWSGSESNITAYFFDFYFGGYDLANKSETKLRVRPVRAF